MMRAKASLLTPVFVGLLLGAAFFIACNGGSGNGDQPAKPETPAGDPVAAPAPAAGKTAPKIAAKVPDGWKQASWEKFRFWIPADWKEDREINIWFPPTESFAAGLPLISLHCGHMPIMGDSVDEQVNMMLHGSPMSKTPVEKCNMTGHIREARDSSGNRHITLTLEEAGFMTMVHFFNFRAQADQFEKYEETFRKILDSIHCR